MYISWALVVIACFLSTLLVFPVTPFTPFTLTVLAINISAVIALRYAAYWRI